MTTPDKHESQGIEQILTNVPNSFAQYVADVHTCHTTDTPSCLVNGAYSRLIEALAREKHSDLSSALLSACEQAGYNIDNRARAFQMAACGNIDAAVEMVQQIEPDDDGAVISKIGALKSDHARTAAELHRHFGKPDTAVGHEVRYRIAKAEVAIDAITKARQEVADNPNDHHALLNLAEALKYTGDPKHLQEGVRVVNQALEIAPESADAWSALAELYEELEDTHKTINALENSLKCKPDFEGFDELINDRISRLASLYRETKNYQRGVNTFRALLEKDPNNSKIQAILENLEALSDQSSQ
jgi:tetratricopeptide (TPR) repeat protein